MCRRDPEPKDRKVRKGVKMRKRLMAMVMAGVVGFATVPAQAWFHAGSEGGHWHASYGGNGSWGHAGGTAGYGWHGSSGYTGYHGYGYHGYGWHQPTVVNHYYGGGCYNCGGWGGVAAAGAVGLAAGAAIGAAAASNNASNAYAAGYAAGATYAALPGGCAYAPINGAAFYNCGGMWLQPAYGANGVFYRTVAAP
jgi:hypothetical protein